MECCRGAYIAALFETPITNHSQIISVLHRRFPKTFTPALVSNLAAAISAPPRASLANLTPEQREKEDSARVARQRPLIRVCSELALVAIIRDAPDKCGGEWIMKAIKELVIKMAFSLWFRFTDPDRIDIP